jgi:molybdate transport system substrate-binding protein
MNPQEHAPLLVYCAASVEPALAPIAAAYGRETGVAVKLEVGPSGVLVEKFKHARRGDLYVPASENPYLDHCQKDGSVTKIVPLAKLRLVLAVNRTADSSGITYKDLLAGRRHFAIAHEEAAAGLATLEALAPLGDWQQFAEAARSILPTVTEVAAAVRDGGDVDCGITWDATARQYGLMIVDLPELAAAQAVIAAGILASSQNAAGAQHFADYLAAPDKGGGMFKTLGYSALDTSARA